MPAAGNDALVVYKYRVRLISDFGIRPRKLKAFYILSSVNI